MTALAATPAAFVRDDEVRRVVHLALRGTSVALVGVRRSGLSTLLREAGRTLDGLGRSVVHVAGARAVPALEPLRLCLPPRIAARLDGATPTFAALHHVLREFLADGEHVVLLDDADLLDPASRGLLALLHAQLGNPVVATARAGDGCPSWLVDAVQPLVHVRVDGLSIEDLHVVLAARVEEPLSPAVTARVHADTAGIPGLAVGVLEAALAHGTVRLTDGTWAVRDDLRSPGVHDAYDLYLGDLPAEVRDAVDLLGLAGPVGLPLAARLLGPDRLDDLEGHDLVRTVPLGTDDVVLLHPPGLADHVARARPGARRRHLLDAAVGRLTDSRRAAVDDDPPRLDRLLDRLRDRRDTAGPAPDPVHRPSPADVPGRVLAEQYRLDLTSAARAWQRDEGVASAARLLRLQLAGVRDPEVVGAVLERTDLASDPGSYAHVELAFCRARWDLALGADPDHVVARLTTALPEGARYRESLSSLAVALRAELRRAAPGDEAVLRDRVRDDGLDSATARVALAALRLLRGEHDGALAALDVDRGPWPPLLADSAALVSGLATFGSGDFGAGLARGRDLAARALAAGDGRAYVAGSLVAALCLGSRMDLDEARRELFGVLAVGARADGLVLAPDRPLRTLLAALALFTRQDAVSPGLLALAEQAAGGPTALPFGSAGWPRALGVYADGAPEGAARALRDEAAALREAGHGFAADVTEMLRLVLHHDAAGAAAFRDTAHRRGGLLFLGYLDVRRALHDGDPDAVAHVAADLVGLDATGPAARCYAQAAQLFQVAGRPSEAAAARETARSLATDAPLPDPAGLRLSAREEQIVALLARGDSNTAIAEQLFLSRRTVESHLRNIKRKTGAADRAAMANLLR